MDFTSVRRSAEAAGLKAVGFSNQAQFLLAANILELAGSPPSAEDAAALRRLMLPGGMGEAFKFLGLAAEGAEAPSGFGGRNKLASLEPARFPQPRGGSGRRMSFWQIILLALLQGVTEFLPISSSAHLILAPAWLGWEDQGIAFDIAVHFGSLIAVIAFSRREIGAILR